MVLLRPSPNDDYVKNAPRPAECSFFSIRYSVSVELYVCRCCILVRYTCSRFLSRFTAATSARMTDAREVYVNYDLLDIIVSLNLQYRNQVN